MFAHIPLLVALLAPAATLAGPGELFQTSDRCQACHNGLSTVAGQDVSIGVDWRSSMMANAARDPYWQASVRRESLDHPGLVRAIEDKCASCHMPMSRYDAKARGGYGRVFANLPIGMSTAPLAKQAADGVSCSSCHQIQAEGLGEEASFTAGFTVDEALPLGERAVYGPFEVDDGRARVMRSSSGFSPVQGAQMQESALCATCHTLFTHAYDSDGQVVGELAEQVPYLEWLHSSYADTASCQSCHMPVLEEPTAISSVLPQDREALSQHVFRGGNFFMPRLLDRFRNELGVVALQVELRSTATLSAEHLQERSARLAVSGTLEAGGPLELVVTVTDLAGHKLPTAYPSRRAWLHLTVRDATGSVVFESGAVGDDGRIEGNDNDEVADRYEPHYAEISSADQVQIYEAILGDSQGAVTTGLLTGTHYLKDNRVLPLGFDASTADDAVAVRGAAREDEDFVGGADLVRYVVDPGESESCSVEVELLYQPIGYRWAHNLGEHQADETLRFVGYYQAMADQSAIRLAAASTWITARPAEPPQVVEPPTESP